NGGRAAQAAGVSGRGSHVRASAAAGTYNVRLFANNTLTRLAVSGVLTVAAAPTLAIDDVTVVEGDSGMTPLIYTVTLAPVSAQKIGRASCRAGEGTAAVAGADYVA